MGKTKQIGRLSPGLMFEMFNTLVRPILLYGSEVWGIRKKGTSDIDKVFLRYIRNVLCIKCTTSNIITVGECGQLPPSVYAHYNVLCYAERLSRMSGNRLVRDVYEALKCLHFNGFHTWVTDVYRLKDLYNIRIDTNTISVKSYKRFYKDAVANVYISQWKDGLTDIVSNPILRTYNLIKEQFMCERYLTCVTNFKYRNALCKLRTGSHTLEIERGRHVNPKVDRAKRLCKLCKNIEDEFHFLIECKLYDKDRDELFKNIICHIPNFCNMDGMEKFKNIMTSENDIVLSLAGKFIYKSFLKRQQFLC
jgi:hypothetical protein